MWLVASYVFNPQDMADLHQVRVMIYMSNRSLYPKFLCRHPGILENFGSGPIGSLFHLHYSYSTSQFYDHTEVQEDARPGDSPATYDHATIPLQTRSSNLLGERLCKNKGCNRHGFSLSMVIRVIRPPELASQHVYT
jgi:hypothetical protein